MIEAVLQTQAREMRGRKTDLRRGALAILGPLGVERIGGVGVDRRDIFAANRGGPAAINRPLNPRCEAEILEHLAGKLTASKHEFCLPADLGLPTFDARAPLQIDVGAVDFAAIIAPGLIAPVRVAKPEQKIPIARKLDEFFDARTHRQVAKALDIAALGHKRSSGRPAA